MGFLSQGISACVHSGFLFAYLLMRVFVSLQGLHDGELCVVFESPGLLAQNLPQHP